MIYTVKIWLTDKIWLKDKIWFFQKYFVTKYKFFYVKRKRKEMFIVTAQLFLVFHFFPLFAMFFFCLSLCQAVLR